MRILITVTLLVIGLASCAAQNAVPASRVFAPAMPSGATRPAGLQNHRLFVSDRGTGDIYLYDLPKLNLVTILQGFTSPQGECADNTGDVWVTDNRADTIYRLAYAGRTLGHIADSTGAPIGCAWDATTGNLAVTNYLGKDSASGGLLVYHHATGAPNTFTNPAQFYYNYAGYDNRGNLFFDGSNSQGKFVLSELPAGGQNPITIKISGATIVVPGMVQWDSAAKYLIVGDQNCDNTATSCLYQLQLSGKTATFINKVTLENYDGAPVCDMVQGVVDDGRIFGSDIDSCDSSKSAVYGWPYPGGGAPSRYVTKNISEPDGATIAVNASSATRRAEPRRATSTKNLDLMYVSEGTGKVVVYTYWQKTLVRTLTGFASPQGECVDKKNDVYITDAINENIVEYAHDGAEPLRTIDDAPYSPYSCAIDFKTGNLAVANSGTTASPGNLAIFAKAAGSPTILSDKAIVSFGACVYDAQGNLLAGNVSRYTGGSYFAWLPAGGTKLVDLKIPGRTRSYYDNPDQGLQWDGRYFVIDNYDDLGRIAIEGGQAYYIGSTSLDEGNAVFGPGWIYDVSRKKQGTQYVGLAIDRSGTKYDGVEYFNYPQGGDETGYIDGIDKPTAVAISLGKDHA